MPKNDEKEQAQLPGMEDKLNKKVHNAAKRYVKARNARMELTVEEKAAHDTLVRIMHEEGIEAYKYDGVEVWLDKTEKAKVKAPEKEDAE